jgi:hypothetical protein
MKHEREMNVMYDIKSMKKSLTRANERKDSMLHEMNQEF